MKEKVSSNMTFQEMINHIEDHNPEMKGSLSEFKRLHWKGLNSLTHSGASQFRNRVKGAEVKKTFSPEFVRELIVFSDRFSIASFVYLARISGNYKLMGKAIDYCGAKLNIRYEE